MFKNEIKLLIFILILNILYYLHLRIKFKSKQINFSRKNQINLNLKEKYQNIQILQNKYTFILIEAIIFVIIIVLIDICIFNVLKIKLMYKIISLVSFDLIIILFDKYVLKILSPIDQKKGELQKLYNEVIIYDLIPKIFNTSKIITKNLYGLEEKEKDILTKKRGKLKIHTSRHLEIDAIINEKQVEIINYSNYNLISNDNSVDSQVSYKCIGFIIIIHNFSNCKQLDNIREKDYYFDNVNNKLYLLVDDYFIYYTRKGCWPFQFLKVNSIKFIEKKYNYFKNLYDYILFFCI